ncbi:hypothetical protein [Paenilisteria weihenstephanensis]|uniref:hypothetical protein n=1 Tax=Listeria weihenstephanensis TaxID=1006155 RepID=UPI0004B18A0F|nr:hypothetical protein [Listeria weihenstephanensis]
MDEYEEMKEDIKRVSEEFIVKWERKIFNLNPSERNIVTKLAEAINQLIIEKPSIYKGYQTDTEYNRNADKVKYIENNDIGTVEYLAITCDLIIHSEGKRGLDDTNQNEDNLIAFEVKKSNNTSKKYSAESDKKRLKFLTTHFNDLHDKGIFFLDGIKLPESVCGYTMGVFYEIDRSKSRINMEFYRNGEFEDRYSHELHRQSDEKYF